MRRRHVAKRRLAAHQKAEALQVPGPFCHGLAQLFDEAQVVLGCPLGRRGLAGAKALFGGDLIQPRRACCVRGSNARGVGQIRIAGRADAVVDQHAAARDHRHHDQRHDEFGGARLSAVLTAFLQLRVRRKDLARDLGAQTRSVLRPDHAARGVALDLPELIAIDPQIIGGGRSVADAPAQQGQPEDGAHADRQCRNDDPERHGFSCFARPM